MSWVNPRTSNEAPFISLAKFQKEVRDNLKYLKTAVETVDTTSCTMRDGSTVAYAYPTGTRVVDTVYQNTSGKIRLITVSVGVDATGRIHALCGTANPPTVTVADFNNDGSDGASRGNVTFIVAPNYYYKIEKHANTVTLISWLEWDIL